MLPGSNGARTTDFEWLIRGNCPNHIRHQAIGRLGRLQNLTERLVRCFRFGWIRTERRRRGNAVEPAQPLQAIDLLARNQVLPPEQARDEADLGEVLDRLDRKSVV